MQKALAELTRSHRGADRAAKASSSCGCRANSSSSIRRAFASTSTTSRASATCCRSFARAGSARSRIAPNVGPKDWLDLPVAAAGAGHRRPGRALRPARSKSWQAPASTAFTLAPPTEQRRRRREKGEGAREANVRSVGRRDAGPDDLGPHGREPEHQEDQARRAGHRRSDPERGNVAHRPDDDARLRRVHVHAQRERLHLLRRARQATRARQAPAVRSRHGGAVPRHRQVARAAATMLEQGGRADRGRVAHRSPRTRGSACSRCSRCAARRSCRTARWSWRTSTT